MENRRIFTAYVEWDPDTNLYVGTIPNIPGAHSQGATLEELDDNLKEALEMCIGEDCFDDPPVVKLATTA